MRVANVVMGAVMAWALTGCAMAGGGFAGVSGTIYSGYQSPGAIGQGPAGRTGEACASSILGIIGTGDASNAAAKAAGGITQISHVDHDNFSVLGIYAKTCTIVHGQ